MDNAKSENFKLTLLKQDLQIITKSQDEYLKHLLEMADRSVKREGIKRQEGEELEYDGIQVQYAAYLFRKRAGANTAMPRFLRYGLNNMLFSQKAGEENAI